MSKWNGVFDNPAYHYGVEPNDWIRAAVTTYILNDENRTALGLNMPAESTAVELACGEGRNAVWLTTLGYDVHAVDESDAGLVKARRLYETQATAIPADARVIRPGSLETHRRNIIDTPNDDIDPFPTGDIVVSTYFHVPARDHKAMFDAHAAATRTGGILIAVWFHPDQRLSGMISGGPRDPESLVTPEALRAHFAKWRVIDCSRAEVTLSEGPGHTGPAIVTRFTAVLPHDAVRSPLPGIDALYPAAAL